MVKAILWQLEPSLFSVTTITHPTYAATPGYSQLSKCFNINVVVILPLSLIQDLLPLLELLILYPAR